MKATTAALIAGAAGAIVTVGYLGWQKKVELERHVANIRAAAEGDATARSALAAQAAGIRSRIGAAASAHAAVVAERVAEEHIYNTFGLTPARVAGIERLSRMLGG